MVDKVNLSVIIITLNEEKMVGNLLDSLYNQSFKDFEVIVVDSDSIDNTEKVVNQYKAKFKNLVFYNMNNKGVSLARNTGIKLANYEKILFLDADTKLKANFLEFCLKEIKKNKLDLACTYLKINDNDKKSWMLSLGINFFNILYFICQYIFPLGCGSCIFSSKKVHNSISGFDTRVDLLEDNDYIYRASKKGYKFRFLPITHSFDLRRVKKTGAFRLGIIYIYSTLIRIFKGKKYYAYQLKYGFGYDKNKKLKNNNNNDK